MKLKTILIALVTTLFLGSCNLMPKPEFKSVKEINFSSDKNNKPVIQALTVYHNPAPVDVTIEKLELDIFLKGEKVGKVHQTLSTNLEAGKETILPIQLDIREDVIMQQAMSSILDIFSTKRTKPKFVFKGTSTASIFGFKSENPVEFEHEMKDLSLFKK